MHFFGKIQNWILKPKNGSCVSSLYRTIQDCSEHGAYRNRRIHSRQKLYSFFTVMHRDLSDLATKARHLATIFKSNLKGTTSGYQQPLLELTLLPFIFSWLKSNSLEGEAGLLVISSTRKTVFVHFSNHRDES